LLEVLVLRPPDNRLLPAGEMGQSGSRPLHPGGRDRSGRQFIVPVIGEGTLRAAHDGQPVI
jgi:hypothetical protein